MIPVKNIYYMLTYVFQLLNEQGYKDLSTEEFENPYDLLSAILERGIINLVKSGIIKDYKNTTEELSTLKGKINFSQSFENLSFKKGRLVCEYDDFSVDTLNNAIIKTTVNILLSKDISIKRKKSLKQLMMYFNDVRLLDLKDVNWNIQYNRNNKIYKLLISICYLIYKGLIQNRHNGFVNLMDYIDESQFHKLYEKFILEYYKKEYPFVKTNSKRIKWQLDDDNDTMLPIMLSDVMLEYDNKVLIIDAKYYSSTYQLNFDKKTIHSHNVYQIFTYVKNKEEELKANNSTVSGMLLYARTDQEIQPDYDYKMSGNLISVKTLDLNCDFLVVKKQLNDLIERYLLSKSSMSDF